MMDRVDKYADEVTRPSNAVRDTRIVQTIDDIERLASMMEEKGIDFIEIHGFLSMRRPAGRILSTSSNSTADETKPPPSDEDLLMNPYAGMENS